MTEDNISWTSFCQAMNSIAFWLIQNKKKYKKRDYYQILTLKGGCSDIEKKDDLSKILNTLFNLGSNSRSPA